jgi:hypothetical protein
MANKPITLKRNNSGTIDNLYPTTEWNQIESKPSTFTPTSHTHAISDVTNLQTSLNAKAPLASPALTGTPTAPTAAANTNSTQIATTAYVQGEITDLIGGAPGALDTLNELAAAINDDSSYASTITTALAAKAPLASPAFTGNVTMSGSLEIAGDLEVVGNTIGFVDNNFDARIQVSDSNPNGTGAVFDFYGDGASRNATLSAEQFDGNAATTTKWLTARTITLGGDLSGSVSLDGSANVTLSAQVADNSHNHTNLNAIDDRDIAPEDLTYSDDLKLYFVDKGQIEGGSNTSNWQDLLVLNSYADSSGGDANALAFDKSEKKIYHYHADQSATNWGSPETIAYVSDIPTNNNQLTNGAGYTTNTGDITSVTAGNGLTGGATSGDATLNVGAGAGITVSADAVAVTNPLYYVEGNTSGTAGTWTGTISGLSAYYDGLTIRYKQGIAGATNVYLNINSLGAAQVYRYAGARLTTHWPTGTISTLTYNSSDNRWYANGDYNSTDDYRIRWQNDVAIGAYVHGYQLLAEGTDGAFYPVTEGGSTGNTNTVSTADLRIGGTLLAYESGTDIAAGGTSSGYEVYEGINSAAMEYWNNRDSGWATDMAAIYLVGEDNGDGSYNLDNSSYTSFLTQTIPTSDDGKIYIHIGWMNNTNDNWRLEVVNQVYVYKDGAFQLYSGYATYAENADKLDGKQPPTNWAATSQTYTTIASAGWDLPTGSSVFSKADSSGGPGTDGYWFVTGRRDVSGGFSGIYTPHNDGKFYAGYSLTDSNPTWHEVWTSGSDGSGSGLDADLLDGQQGSYYLDYNNLTNVPSSGGGYTHPTHPGDDINIDTGALTGATVISDLDFNITSDTEGHITDANATVSTRNLTASDIGAAAASHTHGSYDNSGTLTGANVYSQVAVTDGIVTGLTSRTLSASDIGAAASSHSHGNLTSAGGWSSSPATIGSGDYVIIGDSSDSSKLRQSSTQFGTSTTTYLRNDGTFASPVSANTVIGGPGYSPSTGDILYYSGGGGWATRGDHTSWTLIKSGTTSIDLAGSFPGNSTGATNVSVTSGSLSDTAVLAIEINGASTSTYTSAIQLVKLENSDSSSAGIYYQEAITSTLIRHGAVRVYRGSDTSTLVFRYANYHSNGSSSETDDQIYIGHIWKLSNLTGS